MAQFVENLNRSLIPRWRPFAVTATVGELGPGGRIRVHDGNALLGIPFLDISGRVTCCGEQGMLDVAFHPGYGLNGQFYVSYSDRNGDTIIARY